MKIKDLTLEQINEYCNAQQDCKTCRFFINYLCHVDCFREKCEHCRHYDTIKHKCKRDGDKIINELGEENI